VTKTVFSTLFVLLLVLLLVLIPKVFAGEHEAELEPVLEDVLEDVLSSHAEARGGRDAWAAAEALELEGTFIAFSLEEPFRMVRQRGDRHRFETVVRDQPWLLAQGPEGPWWVHPDHGYSWPAPAAGTGRELLVRAARFEPPLFGGGAVIARELLGPGEVDGLETVRVRVTWAGGVMQVWHLDPETFLEVALDSIVYDPTQALGPIEERAYFSDFREVGALVLPFRVEREYGTRHTVLAVDEAKLVPELGPETFRRPEPEGMEALWPLLGEWQLEIERPVDPEGLSGPVRTTSRAELAEGGALLIERFGDLRGGAPHRVERRWSFDRFQGIYRVVRFDDGTGQLSVFEGTFDDEGHLVLDNLASGTHTTYYGMPVHERLTVRELGPGSVEIGHELTFDGENWQSAGRFLYRCP